LSSFDEEPFSSPKQLLSGVHFENNISPRSARRMLSSRGLFGRIAARKPLLGKSQICKWISFCKAYRQMSSYERSKILFTDEMRIEMYGTRQAYVRRKIGTRCHNKFVCKTVKFGGRSLLVWKVIKEDSTRILLRCPPILNSSGYQCILDERLKDMYDRDSVLMHDGAPCHRSMSTQT